KFAIDWYDWATPIRVVMQGPNTMPKPPTPLNAGSVDRWRASFIRLAVSGPFSCPSNFELALKGPGGLVTAADPAAIPAPSYLSTTGIMRAGLSADNDFKQHPQQDRWEFINYGDSSEPIK